MLGQIPVWLGAIIGLLTLASILGAAVAVYKTSVTSTSLQQSDANVVRLRGEISDYQRRELELEHTVELEKAARVACEERVKVLEDLLTKRKDDDQIRAEIAAVRRVVDENVLSQLTHIAGTLERMEARDA